MKRIRKDMEYLKDTIENINKIDTSRTIHPTTENSVYSLFRHIWDICKKWLHTEPQSKSQQCLRVLLSRQHFWFTMKLTKTSVAKSRNNRNNHIFGN